MWPRIEARSRRGGKPMTEILHGLQMRETRNKYKILSRTPANEGTMIRFFLWIPAASEALSVSIVRVFNFVDLGSRFHLNQTIRYHIPEDRNLHIYISTVPRTQSLRKTPSER
jgi:hypothetical protein